MIYFPFEQPPAEGEAIRVAEGVLWLRMPLPLALDHVNVYALDEGEGWTIIDTGFDSGRSRKIWQALLDGPLEGRPILRVIGTHHHPDHIGLAGWLMQEHGAELIMSRTAWLLARMLQLDLQEMPTPQAIAFWRKAGMPADIQEKRVTERPFNFADVVHPLPPGYTRLTDGQEIRMGGRLWRVAMGHGHAPCHATFWSQDDDLVIGGDQLLASISPNLGVHPNEPDADPVGDFVDSCQQLSTLAEDRHLVLPGHKLPYTGLPERFRQLIENHYSALQRLEDALRKAPRTAVGCFDILFKRKIDDSVMSLALSEAVAHINHLRRKDVIKAVGETDGAVLWGA